MRYLLASTVLALLTGPAPAQTPTTGLVNVRLPHDARLYVDDMFCPLPGQLRSFETPPLDPGRRYFYTLVVEINVEGKPIRLSKRVDVQAGRRSEVDFGTREHIVKEVHALSGPMKPADPVKPPR